MLLAPLGVLGAAFEGRVDFKISAERGRAESVGYLIKNGRIRLEVAGQKEGGVVIMDVAKKTMLMIMEEQRMYMEMAMPDVAAQAAAAKPEEVKLERTGEKAKIAGYDAEKYVAMHQGKKTDLWLAEGLGSFLSMPSGGPMGGGANPGMQAWERALAGKELFPLRVIGYDGGGREVSRMEVTAIAKKALPDALFAPPAGFQKLDMGGMMQGLPPGMIPGSRK